MMSLEALPEIVFLGTLVTQPIAVVLETAPLAEVRVLLVELRVPAVAVVDGDRCLTGVITRTDVLRDQGDPDARAKDAMSGFVFSLTSEASIECAAALMAIEGVGQVVVTTRDGELLGMVSSLDIARHVAVRAGYLAA